MRLGAKAMSRKVSCNACNPGQSGGHCSLGPRGRSEGKGKVVLVGLVRMEALSQ